MNKKWRYLGVGIAGLAAGMFYEKYRKSDHFTLHKTQSINNRITCIVGAGAALDIGGPTTMNLTQEILEASYFKSISKTLDDYYGESNYNFEDLLHLIESLDTYRERDHNVINELKPILGAFVEVLEILNQEELYEAKRNIYRTIWEKVEVYNNDISTDDSKSWYLNFWRNLHQVSKLDVLTLNYDNTIQSALGKMCTDGYLPIKDEEIERLSVNELYRDDLSKVLNLHGSIFYGYYKSHKIENRDRLAYTDSFHDLYKYPTSTRAKERYLNGGISSNYNQSREVAEITPIITGLKKTEKLLGTPYKEYHHYLFESVRKNEALLIVGYSFGDLHINAIIERITALHGENRKIVVITYVPPEKRKNGEWHMQPNAMLKETGGWLGRNELLFYTKASEDGSNPLGKISFEYKDHSISYNGKVKIYFEGFKKAVENHGDEIIRFLTT